MTERWRREQLIAHRRARAAEQGGAERISTLVERIRSFYYPKQRKFFRSSAKRRATKKTRRSGATAGGCRELVSRALETPSFRGVYATTTRKEARQRAWLNDTQSGLVDVVRTYGTRINRKDAEVYDMAGVTVELRHGDLQLVFGNGSLIELFGANNEDAINKLRGLTKHVWWIDEAQDFGWLERLYKAVISAGSTDFGGEVWLTGTPGRDLIGFFYEVTKDDGPPLTGWEVHQIAVTDNPYFGKVVWEEGEWSIVDNMGVRSGPFATEQDAEEAARKVRWERSAGETIRANGWSEDDPDTLREWFARWVKSDARYVYAAHAVPEHELTYAPMRYQVDGFPDIARALLDLPGRAAEGRPYVLGLGTDLGTTRAFAWSLVAWSLQDPVLYEVATWKQAGLNYDQMAAILRRVGDQVAISMWVADAGGGGKPAVMGWSDEWKDRYSLPFIEATKVHKAMAIGMVKTDTRCGRLRMRSDSPLLAEWKTHVWAPLKSTDSDGTSKLKEDPRSHRDCSDAYLYIHRESYHHRWRPEPPKVLPGTPEHLLQEERELESATIDDMYR